MERCVRKTLLEDCHEKFKVGFAGVSVPSKTRFCGSGKKLFPTSTLTCSRLH